METETTETMPAAKPSIAADSVTNYLNMVAAALNQIMPNVLAIIVEKADIHH